MNAASDVFELFLAGQVVDGSGIGRLFFLRHGGFDIDWLRPFRGVGAIPWGRFAILRNPGSLDCCKNCAARTIDGGDFIPVAGLGAADEVLPQAEVDIAGVADKLQDLVAIADVLSFPELSNLELFSERHVSFPQFLALYSTIGLSRTPRLK